MQHNVLKYNPVEIVRYYATLPVNPFRVLFCLLCRVTVYVTSSILSAEIVRISNATLV